ncbi:MAG: hypothetical protein INR69_05940 [Mucilaginibacter polytrichastri]|nr:hypothetical protein [Mucilaginibacter polytrichastri]
MANTKLTLSLEAQVIEKAKKYAAEQGTSVSKMVEKYLKAISGAKKEEPKEPSDWVKSLRLTDTPTPDFDHKEAYRQHIIEKYSK